MFVFWLCESICEIIIIEINWSCRLCGLLTIFEQSRVSLGSSYHYRFLLAKNLQSIFQFHVQNSSKSFSTAEIRATIVQLSHTI